MSRTRECKFCGSYVPDAKDCMCNGAFYSRKARAAKKKLEQAEARCAELESQPATVQLSELMRGLEISSGFLTMPPYIFYLTGKKIADQAKEATDAAILRKQAEAVEAIEAKYRPYGLSESYTAFAVSENLQAEANRLRQQATDLEEPPS